MSDYEAQLRRTLARLNRLIEAAQNAGLDPSHLTVQEFDALVEKV